MLVDHLHPLPLKWLIPRGDCVIVGFTPSSKLALFSLYVANSELIVISHGESEKRGRPLYDQRYRRRRTEPLVRQRHDHRTQGRNDVCVCVFINSLIH